MPREEEKTGEVGRDLYRKGGGGGGMTGVKPTPTDHAMRRASAPAVKKRAPPRALEVAAAEGAPLCPVKRHEQSWLNLKGTRELGTAATAGLLTRSFYRDMGVWGGVQAFRVR